MLWATNPVSTGLNGDKLIHRWLVFSRIHTARNGCHSGDEGVECQIPDESGITKPLWSDASSLCRGRCSGWEGGRGWEHRSGRLCYPPPKFKLKTFLCVKQPADLHFLFCFNTWKKDNAKDAKIAQRTDWAVSLKSCRGARNSTVEPAMKSWQMGSVKPSITALSD